jgi:NADH:ubiquinone oxidoreductase subunit 2 (subunit N)
VAYLPVLDLLQAVKIPYMVLGAAFVLAAVLFKLSSVPDRIGDGDSTSKMDR